MNQAERTRARIQALRADRARLLSKGVGPRAPRLIKLDRLIAKLEMDAMQGLLFRR